MRAAVTGATGYVGRFIVAKLVEQGVELRAWRRPASDLSGLPQGIEWMEGSLDDERSARRLVADADVLIHAALDHLPGRYRGGEGSDPARFLRSNVGGSLALLAAARAAGVGRCVVLSSRAVFDGVARCGPIGDDEPVRPTTEYGAAKAALEVFVESWGAAGWPIAALRPTGVYGMIEPAVRSKWFDLVGRALRGEAVPARAATEVHGRDVAEAVWLLIGAEPGAIAGRAFNCSDLVVTTRDLVTLVQAVPGITGPLPDAAPAPKNGMECRRLSDLGLRFGGRALLEKTIAELVAAQPRPVS